MICLVCCDVAKLDQGTRSDPESQDMCFFTLKDPLFISNGSGPARTFPCRSWPFRSANLPGILTPILSRAGLHDKYLQFLALDYSANRTLGELAYLEALLRAADYAASANPSRVRGGQE